MKKYFKVLSFFLIIGIMMQSCKEDKKAPSLENQVTEQEANAASWNQVQKQLNTLDMTYVHKKSIKRTPELPGNLSQIPNYNDWELPDLGGNWYVATADADGAYRGILAGCALGGAFGSMVPAIGNVAGALEDLLLVLFFL